MWGRLSFTSKLRRSKASPWCFKRGKQMLGHGDRQWDMHNDVVNGHCYPCGHIFFSKRGNLEKVFLTTNPTGLQTVLLCWHVAVMGSLAVLLRHSRKKWRGIVCRIVVQRAKAFGMVCKDWLTILPLAGNRTIVMGGAGWEACLRF